MTQSGHNLFLILVIFSTANPGIFSRTPYKEMEHSPKQVGADEASQFGTDKKTDGDYDNYKSVSEMFFHCCASCLEQGPTQRNLPIITRHW